MTTKKDKIKNRILAFLEKAGPSQKSKILKGIRSPFSPRTLSRYLEEMHIQGLIEKQGKTSQRKYFVASRLLSNFGVVEETTTDLKSIACPLEMDSVLAISAAELRKVGENQIFNNIKTQLKGIASDPKNEGFDARLGHIVTKMLNNVIDHSNGTRVIVRAGRAKDILLIEIEDDGIGVFYSVKTHFGI